jgi:hypothetical protein
MKKTKLQSIPIYYHCDLCNGYHVGIHVCTNEVGANPKVNGYQYGVHETVSFKEGQKSVLRALLEIADVGEIEEVRKSVCYYMQENDIKL